PARTAANRSKVRLQTSLPRRSQPKAAMPSTTMPSTIERNSEFQQFTCAGSRSQWSIRNLGKRRRYILHSRPKFSLHRMTVAVYRFLQKAHVRLRQDIFISSPRVQDERIAFRQQGRQQGAGSLEQLKWEQSIAFFRVFAAENLRMSLSAKKG